jgi:hypothetical protein
VRIVRPIVVQQLRIELRPQVIRLNARHQAYANPHAMTALDATCTSRTTTHLLFDQWSETEIAIHWVEKETPGAVPIKRQQQTGLFSFGPVVTLYPGLKVQRGRLRQIPFRLDESDEGSVFVLDLTNTEVILSSRGRQE